MSNPPLFGAPLLSLAVPISFRFCSFYGFQWGGMAALTFQKAERGLQRAGLAPFSKTAPLKWDDAQKWIASPTSNQTKNGQPHGLQGGVGLRKNNQFGYGSRQTSMKVFVEVPDQILISCKEADTK
ncbi:hypothetical protein AgCh_002525 [Apium graveolens]